MSREEVPESEVNLGAWRLDICKAVSTAASEVIVHVVCAWPGKLQLQAAPQF